MTNTRYYWRWVQLNKITRSLTYIFNFYHSMIKSKWGPSEKMQKGPPCQVSFRPRSLRLSQKWKGGGGWKNQAKPPHTQPPPSARQNRSRVPCTSSQCIVPHQFSVLILALARRILLRFDGQALYLFTIESPRYKRQVHSKKRAREGYQERNQVAFLDGEQKLLLTIRETDGNSI